MIVTTQEILTFSLRYFLKKNLEIIRMTDVSCSVLGFYNIVANSGLFTYLYF